jgi:hypothetical protein
MTSRPDNRLMTSLLIILVAVAAVTALGALAILYGADSRSSNPRDARPNWR